MTRWAVRIAAGLVFAVGAVVTGTLAGLAALYTAITVLDIFDEDPS